MARHAPRFLTDEEKANRPKVTPALLRRILFSGTAFVCCDNRVTIGRTFFG